MFTASPKASTPHDPLRHPPVSAHRIHHVTGRSPAGLAAALHERYRIDRELGAGGMARPHEGHAVVADFGVGQSG